MQLLINRLLGFQCEACGRGTREGIGSWEFSYSGKQAIRLLCYMCAIQISVMWINAGGKLMEPAYA